MERVPSISLYRPKVKKKGEEAGKLVDRRFGGCIGGKSGRDRRESTGVRNRREALRRAQARREELERGEKSVRSVSWERARGSS